MDHSTYYQHSKHSQHEKTLSDGLMFGALLEESLARKEMRLGEVITAEVVRVEHNVVVVNAGLKSEAYVPIEEFKNDRGEVEVKAGDLIQVAIEALENGYGETRLSRDKAKRLASWYFLENAMNQGDIVSGMVVGKVKGGLTVMTHGVRAFLPGSLVDMRPIKDTSPYEGKELEFKVIKLDKKRNNVVVSRRAVLEVSMGAEREKLLSTLAEGATVSGTVKNITDYGAFVDLGGIDGLLHITDLAWRRVKHPSEVLTVGQEVTAKVLKFDQEKNRVSLGLKQLGDDPWVGLARRYPQGTRLFGKVTNITDYGAFVEIDAGIEGLVHVSEMDWTNKNVSPSKVVSLGDEVEVMILEIDEDRRRISLGIKQCQPNPWDEFAANYKKGDKVSGAIKSITDFGVFIGLPGGIDGLIHLSDLSWTIPGEQAVRDFKKGQEVEAAVLGIDVERERISLGIKQLDGDPFNNYIALNDKGAIVTGTVKSAEPKGAVIQLADDVEGYLRASEVSRERVEDIRSHVKEGETVEVMIINVDRKTRNISLSIKAKDSGEGSELLLSHSSGGHERWSAVSLMGVGALLRKASTELFHVRVNEDPDQTLVTTKSFRAPRLLVTNDAESVRPIVSASKSVAERIRISRCTVLARDDMLLAGVTVPPILLERLVSEVASVTVACEFADMEALLASDLLFATPQPIIVPALNSNSLVEPLTGICVFAVYPSGAYRSIGEVHVQKGANLSLHPAGFWQLFDPMDNTLEIATGSTVEASCCLFAAKDLYRL